MILKMTQHVTGLPESIKIVGDITAGTLVVASLASWIPWLLAAPGAIYACLRIYEWFEKRRNKQ